MKFFEIFISLIFRISFFLSNFLCIDCKILQRIFFQNFEDFCDINKMKSEYNRDSNFKKG